MPRIRCNYEGCIHLEGSFCTAGEIELDQELGCLTYSVVDDEIEAVVADEEEEEIEEAVIAEWDDEDEDDSDIEDVMDAIIALDDLHRSGKISDEAYQSRREEFKNKLKK